MHTCEHLEIDVATTRWVCGIANQKPSGMESKSIEVDDIRVDARKTLPVCTVFNIIGARWLHRSISKKCDKALVVKDSSSLFEDTE